MSSVATVRAAAAGGVLRDMAKERRVRRRLYERLLGGATPRDRSSAK